MSFVTDFDKKGTNAARLALSLDANQGGFRFLESDTGKSYRWDGSGWDLLSDNSVSVTGLLELKGSTDCSSNPNYPAGSIGDAYYVSVAGKIGGASGKSVEVGDLYVAKADNAGGTEGSVGTSWFVLEHNLVGALVASNNLSDLVNVVTARANLGIEGATADVASGSTTNIGAATSMNVRVTGTTTITAFDTVAAGIVRHGYFAGILTLTHNGTSLILPGAANITTAAGDAFDAISLGSGNWKVLIYQKADGTPIVGGGGSVSDTAYGSGWNGDTTTAPSKNAVYDKIETLSGGATLLKSFWSPDAPPASPSGTDSEFSAGSNGVPTGFTEYDPGTLLTVTESSTYNNVQLLAATTAVTLDVLGIYKAIPAGDFTIWTKANFIGVAANYNFTGLCLWEDATDSTKKIAGYGLSPRAAAVIDNGIYNFTNWNTFASATESNLQFVAPCVYIRLRRTSTTYMLAFSKDGEAFIEYSAAVNPAFTPTHFGVGIGNTTGANALATFDFFRYVASDVGRVGILAGQVAGIYQ